MNSKIDIQRNSHPVGYNPIAEIRGAMFHEICVPFNNVPVWCYVTCLNAIQIQSCGNISCLYFGDDEIKINKSKLLIKEIEIELKILFEKLKNKNLSELNKLNIEKNIIETEIKLTNEKENHYNLSKSNIIELIEKKNAQETLVKLTLVKPSFDEIIGMITETNFLISEKKQALEKINNEIKSVRKNSDRKKLEKKAEQIEFYLGFLLPDDTMSFLTAWALGVEITDIKKLSRDILLDAAIMAANGKDNPCDHITGIFTDFQREDINKHGWHLYNQFIEDKKREERLKKNGYVWKGK